MTGKPKILRVEIESEPVRIQYEDQILANAESEAEKKIHDAQKAGERIQRAAMQAAIKERSKAIEEAENTRKQAEVARIDLFQQVHQQALQEAKDKVDLEYRPMVEQAFEEFGRIIQEARSSLTAMLEDNKEDLIDLALQVARCVILRVQEEDRMLVLRTVEEALERARERQQLTLHVHPDSLKILEIHQMDIIQKFDDLKTIKFEEDRRVDRGGVRIETPSGIIDARIRTQIDEIIQFVLPQKDENDPGL